MKRLFCALLVGFVVSVGSGQAIAAPAKADAVGKQARLLLTRLKKQKPKKHVGLLAAPLFTFSSSPSVPIQGQKFNLIANSENDFSDRDLSVEAKWNGEAVANITSPSRGLFLIALGIQNEIKASTVEATLFLEDPKTNKDIRSAVKALDTDISRITTQINAERDPTKRRILQSQREEKIALKTELLTQLKRFRSKVGTQSYSFAVQADPTSPDLPKIADVRPMTGSVSGGTEVTILGQNFTPNVQVKFGGIPAQSATYISQNKIVAVTPSFSGVSGAKDVELIFTTTSFFIRTTTTNVVLRNGFFAADFSGAPGSEKPVAVASGSRKMGLGDSAELDGSQSYSPRGTEFGYAWTFVSVPANSNYSVGQTLDPVVNPTITPSAFGTYVIQLVVHELSTEEQLQSDPSIAVVQVDGSPNPIANPIVVPRGGTGTTQVLPNDATPGDSHFFLVIQPPLHGTATVSSSGLVTYHATSSEYTGEDSIGIQVTDLDGHIGTVTIPVIVGPSNHPPQPSANPITTHGEPQATEVYANDPDQQQTFTYEIATPPQHGIVSVSPDGFATYASEAGYVGSDIFIVRVTDNGDPQMSGLAPVSVTVLANSTPELSAPVLRTTSGNSGTTQITVVDVLLNKTVSDFYA